MFLEVSTELLERGYAVRFRPAGHSMHPTIRDGEPVRVEPVRASEVARGDIILYRAERGPIAHRVVGIEESAEAQLFRLRGDACTSCDAPIMAGQILGRVVAVERGGREIGLAGRRAALKRAARATAAPLKVLVRSVVQRVALLLV